jgi:23S rRNA (guanine2445-N2)-methyltransferase / 23S rRNA (guanine2069-N7)-methyltransferase
VYERDAPDVPLIIDVYHDRAHVFEYEREHSRSIAQQAEWFDACQAVIGRVLGMPAKHVVMKRRHRQREGQQHTKYDSSGEAFLVEEAGLKFWVNLRDYTDTGLFLDHRLTRGMVRAEAKGKRFLNLFAYTGSFTVYAAAGGAASTTTVDLSNTYLDWAQANLEANGLWDARRHRLIRSDIREFLVEHPPAPRDGRGAYDLAVVDPPTFSNSKSTETDWDVQVDHVPLLTRTAGLMSPGGVIYFSNNFRRFKLDEPALTEAVPGLVIREITHRTIPPEYRNQKIHRCWRLVVPGAE